MLAAAEEEHLNQLHLVKTAWQEALEPKHPKTLKTLIVKIVLTVRAGSPGEGVGGGGELLATLMLTY